MKRRILILLAIILTLSLCSCDYLDELKATQFTWTDNGYTTLVSRDGKEYKALPIGIDISGTYMSSVMVGSLTAPDVPLLLGDLFGSIAYIYEESGIIRLSSSEYDQYFCLADRYDAVKNFLDSDSGDYGQFFFSYETREYELKKLTDHEKAIIDNVLANGVAKSEKYDTESDIAILTSIYRVNEELKLDVHEYDIAVRKSSSSAFENGYYIVIYGNEAKHVYAVPEEYNSIFENLIL